MEGEWASVRLGEVTEMLTGFPFKSDRYVDDETAPRLLRGDNIGQGLLRWDGAKRWPSDAVENISNYWLREDDVILAMDRPWIEAGLKYATVRSSDLPSLLVQRVARLRGTDRLDTRFLKFVIGSRTFTDHVLAIQTGTAVPHISGGQIKSFKFLLPPLAEQRAIAHILGALDDKIDLNRQMNETLEAMARAIFKSWFVDFDVVRAKSEHRWKRGQSLLGLPAHFYDLFPDSLEESDFGEIPAGWKTRVLYETADFINGTAFKNEDFCNSEQGLPVIKIAELKDGITAQTKYSTRAIDPKQRIDTGDLLYSWSGSPDTSLDAFLWTNGRGLLNQHIFKVLTPTIAEKRYVYYLLKYLRSTLVEIARNKQTTGLGHVTVADMKRLYVCAPPLKLLAAFDHQIAPLFDRAFHNMLEIHTLADLRDTLLPKLISGKLRLMDAKRIMGKHI
jgi:type I restriction enzyme, S subunit